MTPPKKKSNRISLNNSQSLSVRYIVNELKKAGFDLYSIAGILGNAMLESSITPGLVGKNYSGTWQNHRTLANQIRLLYGGHDLLHLVRYIIDWTNSAKRLKSKKYSGTAGYKAGEFKKSGYKSAQEASDAFLKLYERAVKKGTKGGDITNYQEWDKRRAYSDLMYEYLYGNQPQPNVPRQTQKVVLPVQKSIAPAPRTSIDELDRRVVRFVPPPGVPQLATSPYLMLEGRPTRNKSQMPPLLLLNLIVREELKNLFQPAFGGTVQPPYAPQPSYARGKNAFPFWNRFGNTMSLRRYDDGKDRDGYYEYMEKVAKDNYKPWGFPNEDLALVHALNDNTYNYRAFYNKYGDNGSNAATHWTDEFKTVYHPTFSEESIYSGKKSQYNPKGIKGGYWLNGLFVPSVLLMMQK